MRFGLARGMIGVAIALLMACGGSSPQGQHDAGPVYCVPGQMISCARLGCAGPGVQVCEPDGSGYGGCICNEPQHDAGPDLADVLDAAMDDAPATDAAAMDGSDGATPDSNQADAALCGDLPCEGPTLGCCEGVCLDLTADPNHCGHCFNICQNGNTCTDGLCQGASNNCGPGGTACPLGEQCCPNLCCAVCFAGTCLSVDGGVVPQRDAGHDVTPPVDSAPPQTDGPQTDA